jgi:hypothetical protein
MLSLKEKRRVIINMDYEQLYQQMQGLEKELKDKISTLQRNLKSVTKNSDKGDLKNLNKDLSQMLNAVELCEGLIKDYQSTSADFDVSAYMESGDYARQMTEYCENLAVDVDGEYPVYEMFPHKVKIDSENQELNVDRKKVQCARPQHFVKLIKQSQDKLNKASFNVNAFLNELADAYTATVRQKEKAGGVTKSGHDILLKDLYNNLVPMQRFRREYDMQSFAFDLARLYNSDVELTKDNRRFEFGTSRHSGKLIRILDGDGKEQLLGTIRFFEANGSLR